MESVTLRGEDFKIIHNTLWELEYQGLSGQVGAERIRAALAGAYQQENQDFESKMDYFGEFKRENGLQSTWSLYELPVHGFLLDHPYPSDAFVVYKDHWGDGPARNKYYPVMGATWGDVYRAADLAIRESGDSHHIFIEGFRVKNGNELHMYTGS